MLLEAPPYYQVNGVTVLRDHADATQFYYQPLAPRFVTEKSGGLEVPRLSLLEFRSAAGGGGFVDFDVHLGLTDDELAEVADGVADLAGIAEAHLSPVPVVDGTVSLMLFGAESGGGAGGGAAGGGAAGGGGAGGGGAGGGGAGGGGAGGFVKVFRHAAHPALYGDERAAFSVELDERGITLLRQAMALEMSPIGVVYGLDYLALRPAYHVRLSIDWDRTQDILDTTFGHESLFTDVQIQDAVEKLEEQRAIVFETDTFVPEDDTNSVLERRDAAVARARDMITDAFFVSSIDPLREEPDGWDKARDVIKSFSPRRAGPVGVFSYRKTHYSRIDRKRLDVDLSESTTIKRTIYPQGHLSGLFRLLGAGFDPARVTTLVDVDDPWFRRRKVTLISRADFTADPVRSMTGTLKYGDRTETLRLDATRPQATVEFPSLLSGGQMVMPVQLTYTVDLVPADGGERPSQLRSGPVEVLGEEQEIQPRELFGLEKIPILTAPRFPFERYPRVDVQLRYTDAAQRIAQDDVVRITADRPSAEWTRFTVGPAAGPVEAKFTYFGVDGRTRETAFAPLTKPQADIADPAPQRLIVKVVEALGSDVERAFVDISYDDRANRQLVEGSLEVLPDQPVEPFVIDRVDPGFNLLRYRITLLMNDTGLIELPASTTRNNRIFVRADLRGHRAVLLRAPADFVAAGLERIEVEARASDDAAGLSFADQFTFTTAGDTSFFEFDYLDPARDPFELRIRRVLRNGLSAQQEWTRFDADVVTVPSSL
ncbi:hypothetical protein [Cryptosporangium sp. NPDC051539]|uniref:hypothetical protein n=1 Tax=Cryptosporangium sp. NPDC051539 TaxID=3363962 RepID=UPI0037993FA1